MKRGLVTLTLGVGLLAVAAAPVIRFIVVPAASQLPADTDTTRTYAGTFGLLLNAAALSEGGDPFLRNVPAQVTKNVTVRATDGSTAVVRDANVVQAGGQTVATSTNDYAVDRRDLAGTSPGSLTAVQPEGQTVSWPVGTEKKDYQYWVQDTGTAVTASYSGTEMVNGLTAYVFTADAASAPIVDQAVLAAFPATLPKATLSALAGQLAIAPAQAASLGQLLAVLPDPVPLSYTYTGQTVVKVEPATGLVLASERNEVRSVAIAATSGTPAVALTPVWQLAFSSTDASVAAAVADARDLRNQLRLGTVVPIALLIGGLALLALGGALWARRRRDKVIVLPGSNTLPPAEGAIPRTRTAADSDIPTAHRR